MRSDDWLNSLYLHPGVVHSVDPSAPARMQSPTGRQIREQMAEYCVPKITAMINRLDGLQEEGLVPRQFYSTPDVQAQQLSLFEAGAEYDAEEEW